MYQTHRRDVKVSRGKHQHQYRPNLIREYYDKPKPIKLLKTVDTTTVVPGNSSGNLSDRNLNKPNP